VPKFQVNHVNGEDLGVVRFGDVTWRPGDEIPLGGGNLRVVDVEWHDEDDEVAGTLTVEIVQFG
jgi:hypothetical protein